MSKKGTEQVQVTWEDQQNINTFSKLNSRRHELEAMVQGLKKELEDLDDASAELVLADDGDDDGGGGVGVRMLVGAAFLHTAKDDAEAKVEALAEQARSKLGELTDELGSVLARLDELKAALYARLGRGNINLEE